MRLSSGQAKAATRFEAKPVEVTSEISLTSSAISPELLATYASQRSCHDIDRAVSDAKAAQRQGAFLIVSMAKSE
jgi:hypothetical protein